jgi:hypothetical protein
VVVVNKPICELTVSAVIRSIELIVNGNGGG